MKYDEPPTTIEVARPARGKPDLRTAFVREAIVQYRGRGLRVETPIRRPDQAIDLARRVVRDEAREHFLALYLDGRHKPIAHSVVSVGTATASLVHPREVFQTAVLSGAVALIVLHNHPSGDASPSLEDKNVATRLQKAGDILGIRLLDSITWTHRNPTYISLREKEHPAFSDLGP